MKRIHILGRKNHGKTTLIVRLIKKLAELGYKVGAIKHTHHAHQLDVPGKDSHRFGEAGAAGVGILSRDQSAFFWPRNASDENAGDDLDQYAQFSEMFASCDFVLVEGDTQTDGKKIEVWRAEVGSEPLAKEDASIVAVVSDDAPEVDCPIWSRSNLDELIKNLLGVLK
ncbi:MAG: molybdopterin-guanine dinucleotide biosynthesis protein B [Lacipirellulaceae bacterium]